MIIYKFNNDNTEASFANKYGSIFNYTLVKGRLIVKQLSNAPFEDVIIFDEECKSVEEIHKIIDSLNLDNEL